MDVNPSPDRYERVAGKGVDTAAILESIRLIMDSGLDYEFRTTTVASLFDRDDVLAIGRIIQNARLYVLQKFVPSKTLDARFLDERSCSDQELDSFRGIMEGFVQECVVR